MNLLQDFLRQWAHISPSEIDPPLNREHDEELEALIESFQKELSHELNQIKEVMK